MDSLWRTRASQSLGFAVSITLWGVSSLTPKTNTVVSVLSLNTASLSLFRVFTALAIIWHLFSHHYWPIALLSVIPSAALTFGYRTRWAAGILAVIAALLIVFSSGASQASDIWMALLCIWCLGLPVNAQWSVDAALQPFYKDNPNATRPPALSTHVLYSLMTKLVAASVLIISVLSVFFSTHTLNLFNLAALCLVFPIALWESFITQLKASPRYQDIQRLIIFYDADCGFCLKMCLVLRELLLTQETRIITAQSEKAIYAIMEANNSWVIQSANKETHIHWHAMQHLFAQRWPFKLVAWIMSLPPFMRLGNSLYAWVAENRSTMSQVTAWALPWSMLKEKPAPVTVFWVAGLTILLTLLLLKVVVL